jgi:hypothetical protein
MCERIKYARGNPISKYDANGASHTYTNPYTYNYDDKILITNTLTNTLTIIFIVKDTYTLFYINS